MRAVAGAASASRQKKCNLSLQKIVIELNMATNNVDVFGGSNGVSCTSMAGQSELTHFSVHFLSFSGQVVQLAIVRVLVHRVINLIDTVSPKLVRSSFEWSKLAGKQAIGLALLYQSSES